MRKQKGESALDFIALLVFVLLGLGFLIAIPMWLYPKYSVYSNEMAGKAELVRAESNRQIATLEAKQVLESAEYLNKADIIRAQGKAEAEIVRAHGVSKANEIISQGLGGAEGYLRYLWIQGLSQEGGNAPQVIYVPTEAGLPILEAGKRKE